MIDQTEGSNDSLSRFFVDLSGRQVTNPLPVAQAAVMVEPHRQAAVYRNILGEDLDQLFCFLLTPSDRLSAYGTLPGILTVDTKSAFVLATQIHEIIAGDYSAAHGRPAETFFAGDKPLLVTAIGSRISPEYGTDHDLVLQTMLQHSEEIRAAITAITPEAFLVKRRIETTAREDAPKAYAHITLGLQRGSNAEPAGLANV